MSGRYILDTNVIIALFASDKSVISLLDAADEVFIPAIALGELYYGAQKSGRSENNIERVSEFEEVSVVLDADATTAREYGRIKGELRTRGKPIPENDIWIAAIASHHGLTLVTRDQHFSHVPKLEIEKW